jgi:GTP-binding protein
VANKTDGIDADQAIADFWSLGLGDIYPIAASHGRGVTSLLEHVLLPWVDEVNPPEEVDEDAEYWAQFEASRTAKKKSRKTTSTRRICRSSWRLSAVQTSVSQR